MKNVIFTAIAFACFSDVCLFASEVQVKKTNGGTSFVVQVNGKAMQVTAWHVVDTCTSSGNCPVGWKKVKGLDVAMRASAEVDGEVLQLAESLPKKGDLLTVFTMEGLKTGEFLSMNRQGRFDFSAELCRGESGSPVLNGNGRVVGVAVAKRGSSQTRCGIPAIGCSLVPSRENIVLEESQSRRMIGWKKERPELRIRSRRQNRASKMRRVERRSERHHSRR